MKRNYYPIKRNEFIFMGRKNINFNVREMMKTHCKEYKIIMIETSSYLYLLDNSKNKYHQIDTELDKTNIENLYKLIENFEELMHAELLPDL